MDDSSKEKQAVWLRPKQATELYGIGRSTIYNWIEQGLIKSTTTRVNRHQRYGARLINRASLEELLDRNATGGVTD